MSDSLEIYALNIQNTDDSHYISVKHDQVSNNTYMVLNGATVQTNNSIIHSSSGISWKLSVTSTGRTVNFPVLFPIAKSIVVANTVVTASIWLYRTNTSLNVSLACKAYQIAGITSDVTASMIGSANTWEKVSIQFTPTETGVIELEIRAYGGSTYSVYIDDFSISQ